MEKASEKLENEHFMKKAPKEIIEKEIAKLNAAKEKHDKLRTNLDRIG